jgi:hypothetical protein
LAVDELLDVHNDHLTAPSRENPASTNPGVTHTVPVHDHRPEPATPDPPATEEPDAENRCADSYAAHADRAWRNTLTDERWAAHAYLPDTAPPAAHTPHDPFWPLPDEWLPAEPVLAAV